MQNLHKHLTPNSNSFNTSLSGSSLRKLSGTLRWCITEVAAVWMPQLEQWMTKGCLELPPNFVSSPHQGVIAKAPTAK